MQTRYLIVGAGLAGASTAWHLARAGAEVVLVEAFEPATTRGSSHGSARIFRHAYPDLLHTALTVRARDAWRELEAADGSRLLTVTGELDFGPGRDIRAIEASLTAAGVDSEILRAEAAAARWPHLRFDSDVLHHPGAGVVDAEGAVHAMVRQAEALGAHVQTGWRLTKVEEVPHGIRATSATGDVIECETLIVAAGAWLPDLLPVLPDEVARRVPPLLVEQQQVIHFPFPAAVEDPTDWPIFVHEADAMVYSLPGGRDAENRGFKIAQHAGGRATTAETRDGIVDPAARAQMVAFVEEFLPTVDATPYAETTCLYTSTPSENFLIDRVGRVVIASPCSGHGAKFAPLLGELVADVATGRREPVESFSFAAHSG